MGLMSSSEPNVDVVSFLQSRRILTDAALFYHDKLHQHNYPKAYWASRDINSETVNKFLLGYSTGHGLYKYLEHKGYPKHIIDKSGLSDHMGGDFFGRDRVIMPITNAGIVTGLSSRIMGDNPPSNIPKYVHLPGQRGQIYGADSIVPDKPIIMCEGQIDRLILEQAGMRAFSPLGVSFSKAARDKYRHLLVQTQRITCIPDIENSKVAWRANLTSYSKLCYELGFFHPIKRPYMDVLLLPKEPHEEKVDVASFFKGKTPIQIYNEIMSLLPKKPLMSFDECRAYFKQRDSQKSVEYERESMLQKSKKILETPITAVLEEILGVELRPLGEEYTCRCINPDHEDNNPSMRVFPKTNTFFCWSCKEWGDAIGAIALAKRLNWKDACDVLRGARS